jgi:hypothetical protein
MGQFQCVHNKKESYCGKGASFEAMKIAWSVTTQPVYCGIENKDPLHRIISRLSAI